MNPHPFIRVVSIALMSWLILLGLVGSNTALAAAEFQLIQSMGKLGGTPYAKLIQDAEGNLYGTTYYGGSIGAGTVYKLTSTGTFEILHEFDGDKEGAKPYAGLIQASDGNFYGTASAGGSQGAGIVFKLDEAGNFNILHEFDGASGGAIPLTGLLQANDGNFYGTTSAGGNNGYGTVFKLDAAGNFTVLHHFDNSDGNYPFGELIQADNGNFYGTTNSGGSAGYGVIFTLDSSGGFNVLHHFNADDGTNPSGSLIQANDGSFYGTTSAGGSRIGGTVFKFDASGNFNVITDFAGEHTGSTYAGVIQGNDGNFYGTWANGGSNGYGSVFKLDPSGNLSFVHEFSGGSGGSGPMSALIQGPDGSFYGATVGGGNNEAGTVFKIDSLGNFSTLYALEGIIDAFYPSSLIQANDGNFYGTTSHGGEYDFGTAFMLDSDGNINILHSFDGFNDGLYPSSLLQADDGSFYGVTSGGFLDDSLSGYAVGTLFKIDSSENFSELYTFDYSDDIGSYANNYLIQGSDGNFYGTTPFGGSAGAGTVFKLDQSGNISILHEFDGGSGGANPSAGVIQASDGNFYGSTSGGGNSDSEGVVFKLAPSGEFSILHTLNGATDGKNPAIPLIQGLDGNFYGITPFGGANDAGTVFKVEPTGNYSILHVFDDWSYGDWSSSLIQSSNGKLYGTRPFGGENDLGVVFELDLSGNYNILHSFTGDDGMYPEGLTQAKDGSIYGFASFGGLFGHGTLFRLIESTQPIANAGQDQTVDAGTLVTLNGSSSSDPDNGPSPLTYSWTQTGGETVTLAKANTAQPSFTPLTPGAYTFNLVVNDGQASSAADSVTVTVNDAEYVLIQSPNGGEVWNEKSKQTIRWASRNLDSKLRLVLYLSIDSGQTWKKVAWPKNAGSKPWKIPKNRYISKQALFKLCVKQNEERCDVSDAVFTINKAPKAEAGKRQKVTAGNTVHLDGSASVDADNGPSPLTYRWIQTSGPTVTLNGADTAIPSFNPTIKGIYKFSLIVNDGAANSKRDKVSVRVVNAL